MAKYTITLQTLIKNNFDFGLNEYPIFDNSYREKLNKKILNHYYNDEIGFETAELFKFYLNQKMEEIMPYYNTLYNAQNTALTNLYNTPEIIELINNENIKNGNMEQNTSNNDTSNSSSNSENKGLYQDTPQGKINLSDLTDQKWATNATLNKNETKDQSETNSNSRNEIINNENQNNKTERKISGNTNDYYIDILNRIHNNLLNIDLLIINELQDLFMGIM